MLPDAANALDSPELGPPPIAHFEDGDPTKFDPSEDDIYPSKPLIPEDEIQPAMFANLETRKRRRETTNLRETVSLGIDSEDLKYSTTTEQPSLIRKSLKSGAKRKLDVAADEDREARKDSEDDGFEFGKNRADSAVNKSLRPDPLRSETLRSEKCLQEAGTGIASINVRETSAAVSKSRKALGPSKAQIIPLKMFIADLSDQKVVIWTQHRHPKSGSLVPSIKLVTPKRDYQRGFWMVRDSRKNRAMSSASLQISMRRMWA